MIFDINNDLNISGDFGNSNISSNIKDYSPIAGLKTNVTLDFIKITPSVLLQFTYCFVPNVCKSMCIYWFGAYGKVLNLLGHTEMQGQGSELLFHIFTSLFLKDFSAVSHG